MVLLLASTPTFLGKVHEQLLKATAEAYVASFFKLGAALGRFCFVVNFTTFVIVGYLKVYDSNSGAVANTAFTPCPGTAF